MNAIIFILTFLSYAFGTDYSTPKCGPIPNVFCQFGGTCPKYDNYQLIPTDEHFRDWALTYHNSIRNRVANGGDCRKQVAKASNMVAVQYDLELEGTATCSLQKCMLINKSCHYHSLYGRIGQNLYKCIGQHAKLLLYTAVLLWYEEVNDGQQVISNFRSVRGKMIEHFTQLVWAKTTHIGCARARNPDTDEHYLSCHYAPAGNIVGENVYKKGNPVSNCPSGTSPGMTYIALCVPSKKDKKGRHVEEEEEEEELSTGISKFQLRISYFFILHTHILIKIYFRLS